MILWYFVLDSSYSKDLWSEMDKKDLFHSSGSISQYMIWMLITLFYWPVLVSQIRYSQVVILELNGVSEVQYKDVMMIDDGKYQ